MQLSRIYIDKNYGVYCIYAFLHDKSSFNGLSRTYEISCLDSMNEVMAAIMDVVNLNINSKYYVEFSSSILFFETRYSETKQRQNLENKLLTHNLLLDVLMETVKK